MRNYNLKNIMPLIFNYLKKIRPSVLQYHNILSFKDLKITKASTTIKLNQKVYQDYTIRNLNNKVIYTIGISVEYPHTYCFYYGVETNHLNFIDLF